MHSGVRAAYTEEAANLDAVEKKRIGTPLTGAHYSLWPHSCPLILASSLLAISSSPILGLMEIDHKISILMRYCPIEKFTTWVAAM
jgi:hypothetical protein